MVESEKNKDKTNKYQKRHRLISVLLIVCTLTLCTVSYNLGRISNNSGYYGQLIDTIVIDSQSQTDETTASPQPSSTQADTFKIVGTVQYSDGTPYQNGLVEMHSEPRYTITDADGKFSFDDVELCNHKISVLKDGQVVASCVVDFTRTDDLKIAEIAYAKLSNGSYAITLPLKTVELELSLSVNDNDYVLEITGTKAVNPSQPSEPSSNSQIPSSGPSPSNLPVTPAPSPSVTHTPQPSVPVSPEKPSPTVAPSPSIVPPPSVAPSPTVAPSPSEDTETSSPDVDVYEGEQKWTQLSHVDIFSPRDGNSGVFKDKDGKNVIKPGSTGKYVFRLQNSNSSAITYSLFLHEEDSNNPKLPMKYRLLKGTSGSDYVGGDSSWKRANEIKKDSTSLEKGESGYFTLEWTWETQSDEEDTAIGVQGGSPTYIINIIIKAKNK